MRRPFSLLPALSVLVAALAVSGCAWTQEERDFYGRGWLNPRELDRPAPYRGPRPVGEASATTPWATPDGVGGTRQ